MALKLKAVENVAEQLSRCSSEERDAIRHALRELATRKNPAEAAHVYVWRGGRFQGRPVYYFSAGDKRVFFALYRRQLWVVAIASRTQLT